MKGFARSTETMHPALTLLLLTLLVVAGMCIGMFLAVSVVTVAYGVDLLRLPDVLASPSRYTYGWAVLMWLQGLSLLAGFGAGAYFLPVLRGLKPAEYFAPRRPVPVWWLLAAMVLMIVSMPALSGLVAWNADAHLPSWLYDLEKAAREKEDQAQALTTFLTKFGTTTRFLVAVLVVAVVPAIAEELTFRGVVLRQFSRWTKSVHWGVWLSAIVFSAIHMQFFGFVPRMVLGVLLGYLFAWSGNILVPMAAHFAQNGFQLLLLFLQQRGTISFDADANEPMAWPLMLISLVLTLGLLYWLQRQFAAHEAATTEAHVLTSHGVQVRTAADVPPAVPPVAGHTLTSHGIETPPEAPAV
ncbi:CPBP family intramembrane glutamic endopeptidase [Hymenobacter latericus]|uniref:CPBP family intramembrane glutamic endopeptidase n=1 Tax=Hymenobacter sp. YIM 151858-1 TaxID=2987688 RepID=UPI002226BC62|nr:CPBP family intramembrane glutamic endopeptidase [Hymenobacter sp. YIM 151858-1]UYZ58490.1 CPBP family intramembrane metalloprotease [Hymenobacter sp. YIM 151858-1]